MDSDLANPELTALERTDFAPLDAGPAILGWLKRRAPKDAELTAAYWIGNATDIDAAKASADHETELMDGMDVSAMDLLRGSLTWAAPVPQRAGLVHLALATQPMPARDGFIIFPWWSEELPTVADLRVQWADGAGGGASDADRAVLLGVKGERYVTTLVQPFEPIDTSAEQDGWVTPGWATSAEITCLRRIRKEMAGSLDPFAALLAVEPKELDAAKLETLARWMKPAGRTLLFDRLDHAVKREGRLRDALEEAMAALAEEVSTPELKVTLTKAVDWFPTTPDLADVLREARVLAEDAELIDENDGATKPQTFKDALAYLNELALIFTDASRLRRVVAVYLRLATRGWTTLVEDPSEGRHAVLVAGAEARFEAHYAGPGADLIAELREDTADALMDAFREKVPVTPSSDNPLEAALKSFDWMVTRVDGAPLMLRELEVPQGLKRVVKGHLGEMYRAAVKAVTSHEFTPDREPQPLTIVATDQLDAKKVDTIARQITGFGIVIGARHPESDRLLEDTYAHANAAALTVTSPGPGADLKIEKAIETSTLVENYGQLELSIDYTGLPQIGRRVANVQKDESEALSLPLPYELDYVEYTGEETGPVPLVYGYDYVALPFYVPNSGVLPKKLRGETPFTPAIGADLPSDKADKYRRTTPVPKVAIVNAAESAHPGIGYVPDEVMPIGPELLEDHPLAETTRDPGLLLLGGDTKTTGTSYAWRPELAGGAKLEIVSPRVSFEDFTRWTGNPHLMEDLSEATKLNEDLLDAIEEARDHSENSGITAGSELLNRLPDPAVRKLSIRLTLFDRLWDGEAIFQKEEQIDIAPYKELVVPSFILPSDVLAFVREIDTAAKIIADIKVTEGHRKFEASGSTLTVRINPGDLCVLSVAPLVKKAHYDEGHALRAFDKRFRDFGADFEDADETFYRLVGTPLLLEAMDLPVRHELADHPAAGVFEALQIAPEGRDRGYALQLCPDFATVNDEQAVYRAFGEVDLITHRWRTTGQPIPDWINPADGRAAIDTPVEVVTYDPKTTEAKKLGPVAKFESGAFFGRAMFDGERRRIKLPAFQPGGGKSTALTLDTVNWPSPAATYFRYAQVFRSRYIGALDSAVGTVSGEIPAVAAFAGKGQARRPLSDRFTRRVAILADTSSGDIVSPQVRHVLPSLAGARDDDAPLPFVLSLGERPFDQYGLADRVVPEITTIQTYALTDTGEDAKRLYFETYRKEVGADPRGRLEAIDDRTSRGVLLRPEGPVGHHFDPAEADAPGFVNSSYLLHLDGLDPRWRHDQMLAAIEVRRMVDPGWAHVPPVVPATPVDAETPPGWSVDLGEISRELFIAHGDSAAPAVLVTPGEAGLSVKVDRQAAYGNADTQAPGLTELCRLDPEGGQLRLVHRTLGKEGFEVLALRQLGAGTFAAPQIVASARYKADGPPRLLRAPAKEGDTPEPVAVRPLLMSGAPSAQWATSGYDLEHVCLGDAVAPLSEARAMVERAELGFHTLGGERTRMTSRDALTDHILGVHTYFAALMLRQSTNEGRKVQLPERTLLLDPNGRAQVGDAPATEEAAIMAFAAPAEVVTDTTPATFDLDAVAPRQQGLLFRCRIVNHAAQGPVSITLGQPPEATDVDTPAKAAVVTLQPAQLAQNRYIDIRLKQTGALDEVRLYGREGGGISAILSDDATLGEANLALGAITLTIAGAASVVMDVSMIPAQPSLRSAWNWDWVFPPVSAGDATGEGPALMETALRPAALRAQQEAVLAPLGVSDPFPLLSE
jgi:hypothetical protein